MDDAVRRVREKLADAGVLDRSVIVFGADRGETFGEHGVHGVHGHARNVLTPVVWVPLFPDASVQTAVSDGSWTYARNATPPEDDEKAYEGRAVAPGAEYLFDRRVDPGENVNLVVRESADAERMRRLLDAHLTEEGDGVVEKGVRIDPSIADRLRAMGYLR